MYNIVIPEEGELIPAQVLPAYIGTITDGKIQGKVPQYIKKAGQTEFKPVTVMKNTFYDCTSLEVAPSIPSSVTNMDGTFANCTSLEVAPSIPSSVTIMGGTFANCTALTTAPEIPSSVTAMNSTFNGCTNLQGTLTINARNITTYKGCLVGATTTEGIQLVVYSEFFDSKIQDMVDEANNDQITYSWTIELM